MTDIEKYEFDRLGYLVLPGLLKPEEALILASVIDELEEHAAARVNQPPRKKSVWGPDYHANPEKGYYVSGERQEGRTTDHRGFFQRRPGL